VSYRKALERLAAYEPGRLLCGEYSDGSDRCAIGVLLSDPHHAQCSMHYDDNNCYVLDMIRDVYARIPRVRRDIDAAGLTVDEAEALQRENDRVVAEGERERYTRVLAWLRERVDEEARDGKR
jgi:hypothetical protein